MTWESFYNNPSLLQSGWGVTLQWESICIVTLGQPFISYSLFSISVVPSNYFA